MTTKLERQISRDAEKLLEGNRSFQITSMCVELLNLKSRIDKYAKQHFPIGKNILILLGTAIEFPGVIACYYTDHEFGLIAEVGPEVVESLPVIYQRVMALRKVHRSKNQYTIDWMQIKP